VSDDKNTYVVETIRELREDIKDIKESVNSQKVDFAKHEVSDQAMAKDIAAILVTLNKNTDSLEEHMRRTDLNEEAVVVLKDIMIKIDARIAPLEEVHKEKTALVRLIKKTGGIAAAMSAIATVLYTIWSYTLRK
jgi:chromosome segregation ATPase